MKGEIRRPLDFIPLPVALRAELALLPPNVLRTWLLLCLYCGEQLNGGLIKNARNWTKDEWRVRVHLKEKLTGNYPGFWLWEEEHLRVEKYDTERESSVLSKRKQTSEAGKRGMGNRWRNVTDDITDVITTDITDDITDVITSKRESKERERGGEKEKEREADALPPLPDGFLSWWEKVRVAHPALSMAEGLPPAGGVRRAALDAYRRCPDDAVKHVELLKAYFADTLGVDKYGTKFWRPDGGEKFLEKIEDVIRHAERWGKETGWTYKHREKEEKEKQLAGDGEVKEKCDVEQKTKKPKQPQHTPEEEEEFRLGREELLRGFDELRAEQEYHPPIAEKNPATDKPEAEQQRKEMECEQEMPAAAVDGQVVCAMGKGDKEEIPCEEWSVRMVRVIPGVRELHPHAVEPASKAYLECYDAIEDEGLLKAYMSDKERRVKKGSGEPYYRTVSQIQFFKQLRRVWLDACEWQAETGWRDEH